MKVREKKIEVLIFTQNRPDVLPDKQAGEFL